MGDDKEKTVIDTIKLLEDLVEQLRQCSRLGDDAEMLRVLTESEVFLTSDPQPEALEEDGKEYSEADMLTLIDERDKAEDMVDSLLDIIGVEHEWSNAYNYSNALDDAQDALARLAAPKPEGLDDDAVSRTLQYLNAELDNRDEVIKTVAEHLDFARSALRQPAPAPSEEDGPLKSVIHALETADDLGSSVVLDPEEISVLRSQLARKDEGQSWREMRFVPPGERGKYLCLFAGGKQEVLYWDNEDWYDTAGIRSPKYWMPLPAAPEPRPTEEPGYWERGDIEHLEHNPSPEPATSEKPEEEKR